MEQASRLSKRQGGTRVKVGQASRWSKRQGGASVKVEQASRWGKLIIAHGVCTRREVSLDGLWKGAWVIICFVLSEAYIYVIY